MIATVASHQVLSLRRQRVFLAMLATLLTMTALAGVLGWSSHQTIVRVYDEAVKLLASTGKPAPPNPFLLKPTLSLLSNMVVYVPLIGALLALIVGHLSIVDDETNGTGRLVFSRQISRTSYVLGKIASAAVVLAVVLAASLLVSVAALLVVNRTIAGADLGRLLLFYGLSWLYLMVFSLIGMVTVLMTRRRSIALLSAMGAWLVITFVIPQFTSGLRPTQSLNPITDPASTSQTFFKITSKLRPYSIVEQYKETSGRILQTASAESLGQTIQRVLPIAGLAVVLVLLTIRLVQGHDFSRSANSE
ncbi:MAG TPA: ABC transporter permease [Ilumatobacteraceae bacterium]|nr:ABC transporter permease [Ilumatobacteraceae bacterium]